MEAEAEAEAVEAALKSTASTSLVLTCVILTRIYDLVLLKVKLSPNLLFLPHL